MTIYNWGLYTLLSLDDPDRSPSDVWAYPVTSQIDAISVPTNFAADIFTEAFRTSIAARDQPQLEALLESNDLSQGWTPVRPVYLHSGRADAIGPHFNSVDAHAAFVEREGNSTLYEYDGDHYTPVVEYIERMLVDFATLRQ